LRVVFKAGKIPDAGVKNVRLFWSDPTGTAGVYCEGTGNKFGGMIGGWDTNCDLVAGDNAAVFTYSQIARIGGRIRSDASDSTLILGEYPAAGIFEKIIDVSTAADRSVLLPGQLGWTEKAAGANQTVTGTTETTVAWVSNDWLEIYVRYPGAFREIVADLDVTISNTGDDAQVDFFLDVSYDNGTTWDRVKLRRVQAKAVGATDVTSRQSVKLTYIDKTYLHPTRSDVKIPRYRINAKGVSSTDTWVISGGGDTESYFRGREVNPK